ncbi:MAG: VOC family protein [Candidatus Acidiferrales bacterium]
MTQAATVNRLKHSHPVFLVNDVVKSAEYYRDVLGFRSDRYWGDPPCFCIVWRDDVEIFLKQPEETCEVTIRPNGAAGAWDTYIGVENADAMCEELRSRGAKILRQPETTVYDMREFEVEDVNGYRLCFAHDTGPAARVS